ncbi:HAD family hydrolase [Nonomuraea soli]|uniref:Putative hydrolase of the HAD superfamily n=1 Tax=Nonomuraea soli TaxID=1032476 RepID=A0A7W0HQ07_9ACTN|nr:HAD family hydrolase [Nonomuraea soli]MBA2891415.1 putative hydrolase of the HAD superfamily [Nonomuraea soli]
MAELALFDLDNTLVDRLAAFRRWVSEFTQEQGLTPEDAAWMIDLDADGSTPMDEFFTALRDRFDLSDSPEALWKAYRARLPELVTCPPEVLAGLRQLREAGWRLGIVTNGMPDNQTGKIRHAGLAELVDGWAISGEERIRKPDARLFRIAAERCGASLADGGWMVGDDPVMDMVGGHFAGLTTVWIDRGVRPWPVDGLRPGHVVADAIGAIKVLLGE